MPRREFLQLAHTYDPKKHKIAGWYASEKLDGTRCFWDGGLSRNLCTTDVPWASITDPKTGKRKAKIKRIASGLWSRYGNPILAPEWFLDQLPKIPLDGELWAGRGNFQLCRSICAGDEPDPRFDQVKFVVYSSPPQKGFLSEGEIKNTNFLHKVRERDIYQFMRRQARWMEEVSFRWMTEGRFVDELRFIEGNLKPRENVYAHRQIQLPHDEDLAREALESFLGNIMQLGGEGVVLRDPWSEWTPKRHKGILKHKPFHDAEGVITGFTSGRQTDKGSKLLGKIGALVLDYEGKRLELSGLTDEERAFLNPDMSHTAAEHPGEDMPAFFRGMHFTVGQTVTFKYRELSDDGIPKEARYWRKRDAE